MEEEILSAPAFYFGGRSFHLQNTLTFLFGLSVARINPRAEGRTTWRWTCRKLSLSRKTLTRSTNSAYSKAASTRSSLIYQPQPPPQPLSWFLVLPFIWSWEVKRSDGMVLVLEGRQYWSRGIRTWKWRDAKVECACYHKFESEVPFIHDKVFALLNFSKDPSVSYAIRWQPSCSLDSFDRNPGSMKISCFKDCSIQIDVFWTQFL